MSSSVCAPLVDDAEVRRFLKKGGKMPPPSW